MMKHHRIADGVHIAHIMSLVMVMRMMRILPVRIVLVHRYRVEMTNICAHNARFCVCQL